MARYRLVYNQNTKRYERIREDVRASIMDEPWNPERSQYKTERGYRADQEKRYKQAISEIEEVENAGDLDDAYVVVEWGPKGAYGRQGQATVKYRYTGQDGRRHYGESVGKRTGGCGYDKQGQAVANAFNESPEFKKVMYDLYESDADVFGKSYRRPYQGPAGVETMRADMKKAGYELEDAISTDNADVYSIRRAKVKNMALKAKSNSKIGWDKITGKRPY